MAFMQNPGYCSITVSRNRGFTLTELLIAMGLVSAMLMVASPWLQHWVWRLQVETVVQSWSADLQSARLQAMRSGQAMRLQRLSNCQALPLAMGDWRCGWQLLKKINSYPLLLNTALAGDVLVQVSPAQNSLDINASGEPVLGGFRVVVQAKRSQSSATVRAICINIAGRLRVVSGNSCT
jgi:prepilin-type N-terminal cleavage/methylation domain-containing protein